MTIAGVRQQTWCKVEGATYDTVSAEVATDAIDFIKLELTPARSWEKIIAHRGSGSLEGEYQTDEQGSWSAEFYGMPANVGVVPDEDPILEAAFGKVTIVGGTSVEYALTDNDTLAASGTEGLHSLQFVKISGSGFYQIANGAWVETLEATIIKGKPIIYTASGGFASMGFVHETPTAAGAANLITDNVIDITAGHVYKLGRNALIKFAAEDNSGAGYRITAVDYVADTITITPGLAATINDADAITAVTVSQTFATGGSIYGAVSDGLTIDSVSLGLIEHKVTLNTGIKPLTKEATQARPTAIFRSEPRVIEGETQLYYNTANTEIMGTGWDDTTNLGKTRNIQARGGPDTAAQRVKLTTLAARGEVVPIGLEDSDVSTFAMPWVARLSAVVTDEYTILYD